MKALLRQVGMIVAETMLYLAILILTTGLIIGIFSLLPIDRNSVSNDPSIVIDPFNGLIFDYFPLLVGSVLGVIIVHQQIFKRRLAFSGLELKNSLQQFGMGLGWSALIISSGFCFLLLFGWITIDEVQMKTGLFVSFIFFFLAQSAMEEFMTRSFLLPTIATRTTIWTGVLVSSLVFTILHGSNPNIGIIPLLNIFLAGLLLAILFISYGKIWAPIGLHAGWNFLQGSFFGFEVSGLDVYSYIDSFETGPDLLTGGAFGFEGSVLATIGLSALSFYFWRKYSHKFKGQYLFSSEINT